MLLLGGAELCAYTLSSAGASGFRSHGRLHRAPPCVLSERIISESDAHAILGVARTATAAEVKRAYKRRARELHPDYGGTAEQFQDLVEAFKKIGGRAASKPGSLESHPMWSYMSELDTYWARELGYENAAGLEEWLQALNWYEENEMEPLTAGSFDEGAEGEVEFGDELPLDESAADEPSDSAAGVSAIEAVLEYRVHLGNEQWRVRWAGAREEESWELLSVIDTEELRDSAVRLRARGDDASPYFEAG